MIDFFRLADVASLFLLQMALFAAEDVIALHGLLNYLPE